MAIKYVDIPPGEADKPKARQAPRAETKPAAGADAAVPEAAGEAEVALPLAKPTPKPRGRKKPLS